MIIPKEIHFIWVGQGFPADRLDNIILWAKLNKVFQVNLWLDDIGTTVNAMFGKQFSQAVDKTNALLQATLEKDGSTKNIKVRYIKELISLEEKFYMECVRYEIDKLRPNYGAASDLLRLIILEKFGGAYYDSDVNAIELGHQELWDSGVPSLHMYNKKCNDIIVCDPNNQLLIELRRKVALNQKSSENHFIQMYDTYLADNPFYIISHTLKKTGPNTVFLLTEEERNKIIEKTTLRKTQQIESAQSWCNRGIKKLEDTDNIEMLYDHLLKITTFEINHLGILRLEDHVNSLFESVDCTVNEKSSMIQKFIKKITHLITEENVQYVQLTFEYKDILEFYQQKKLMAKTCLLPWDNRLFVNSERQGKKIEDLVSDSVNVLSNLTNIVIQNSNNLHKLTNSLKICTANSEESHGKQYEKLEQLKTKLQEGMVNNTWLDDIINYLQFAVEYINKLDNNTNIQNMLVNLKTVVQARLSFAENYIIHIKYDSKMTFLLEKLNMIKESDSLVIQDIECLLKISKGEIANFKSNFEKQEAENPIWEYSSGDENEDSNFYKIKSFLESLKEPIIPSRRLSLKL